MWPKSYYPHCVAITTASWEGTYPDQMLYGANDIRGFTSSTWPGGAKRVILYPFSLHTVYTPLNFFILNGATAAGNLDVGIYTNDGSTTAQKIWSSGSTAQTGTSVLQTFAINNVELGPGNYYLAATTDNATTTAFITTISNGMTSYMSRAQVTLSALPLTASLTLGAGNSNQVLMGITNRSVV